MVMRVLIDGRQVDPARAGVPVDDPGFTTGWTVFETARVIAGRVPQRRLHLERLVASAAQACVPCPRRAMLDGEIDRVLAGWTGLGRLRITLSGSGLRVVTLGSLDPSRRGQPVTAVRGPHGHEPYLGGAVKHGSRAPWRAAVARSGADEVLLVDGGRFTEATTAAVVAVIDGAVWTAPDDGRILPSTTVHTLVQDARALGVRVVREAPPASGGWQGLYVASATRWLSPVVTLDGAPQPGWEPVGEALLAADGRRLGLS